MDRIAVSLGLTAALICVPASWGKEIVVWQIGTPDQRWSEFAFAGKKSTYAKEWGAKPVVFEVGRSDPSRDWPFVQPGPVDTWAPAHGEQRTIRFSMADRPRGVYVLRVQFTDVAWKIPPRFVIALGDRTANFQLPPGSYQGSLRDPQSGRPQQIELPLPAAFLRKGLNEIRLTCAEGGWVLYDAITLAVDPEGKLPADEVRSVRVLPHPVFFQRGQGRPECRSVDIAVSFTAPPVCPRLQVEAAGRTIEVPFHPLALSAVAEGVEIPCLSTLMEMKVQVFLGDRVETTAVSLAPPRQWRLYLAPSAHTDLGYTDLQPKCAEQHIENVDAAIDLIHRVPDFRWNLEVAWQAENYIHARSGERLADFYRLAREGKIGIQALYCNVLTGLCSHEEVCRLTSFAHKLCREQGIPYKSAMLSDVPTEEASLPMVLAGAGIRYFSNGINPFRAFTFTEMQGKCPCWWEGPDGSRVLMMYSKVYAQAFRWGLDQTFDTARTGVIKNLRDYESRDNYPFDAVFLHGAVEDNRPLNVHLAEVVQQWNDRYEFPKIIFSLNAEFFEYVEKHYGDKLPVYRGSAGTYWEDGAASSARETALCRNAHEKLTGGETLLSLADRIHPAHDYPAEAIYAAWRNCILYDEHTWGASSSFTKPESEFTKGQWRIKSQFARDAAAQTAAILDRGSKALAGLVRTEGPALVVVNRASWARTDVLSVDLPQGLAVVDPEVPSCATPHGTLLLVKDVPACGYRVLKLGPQPKPQAAAKAEGRVIESRFYRVEFDETNGGIASIRDKQLDRELVDSRAPLGLNQYVYVAGGSRYARICTDPLGPAPDLKITASGKATLERSRAPGIGETMTVRASGSMASTITSEICLWDELNRIDIIDRFDKTPTYDKEGVYFAFPFAAREPIFRYEAPVAIVNANTDMLPGACLDWFTVQHFVEVQGRDATIAWATPDAPLVCFQDINRGKWQTRLPLLTGHLYAYVMNNYHCSNYLAAQGGPHTSRFAITSRPKADNVASARFGWAVSNPLAGVVVGANREGLLPGTPTSLVSVAEPNVIMIGTKQADVGRAIIVRLWEVAGRATTAHLRLQRNVPATRATTCNLVEEPEGLLDFHDGQIAVPIRGSGLATVRIE